MPADTLATAPTGPISRVVFAGLFPWVSEAAPASDTVGSFLGRRNRPD
jgi:hypothetical protein